MQETNFNPALMTRKVDPFEEISREFGVTRELLFYDQEVQEQLFAMECDPVRHVERILERRPPIEESMFRVVRPKSGRLRTLREAQELVGKVTGPALTKRLLTKALTAWKKNRAMASQLELPPESARDFQTLAAAAANVEGTRRVPKENQCSAVLLKFAAGELTLPLDWAVEMLQAGETPESVLELVLQEIRLEQDEVKEESVLSAQPQIPESDDPFGALRERLELLEKHDPAKRKVASALLKELADSMASSTPLAGSFFHDAARVLGPEGRNYLRWLLELGLNSWLAEMLKEYRPYYNSAADSRLQPLLGALTLIRTGELTPSAAELLSEFERNVPGIKVPLSFEGGPHKVKALPNWGVGLLRLSSLNERLRYFRNLAAQREKLH